jgi:UDP-glucose-4-epimerase GalE
MDNLIYGHEWAVKWGPLIKTDLLDREGLQYCFDQYHPEAVIHFAAFAYVGESVQDPGKYYYNNVAGTLNLLEIMRENGCRELIFSSTCALYGNPQYLPLDENHPCEPINPYGQSKLMIETILNDYRKAYNFRTVSLRYFNAAGADPDREIGEDHRPETHLIPLAIKATSESAQPLTVFGNDHPTSDGTCIRDYIHVTDLAEAHLLALEYINDNKESDVFNLGNGNGYSIRQIIDTTSEVAGHKVKWQFGEKRKGDPPTLVADASKAKSKLKWEPKYKNLKQIISHAYQWSKKTDRNFKNGNVTH